MADKIIHSRLFPCIYMPLLFIAACLSNFFEAEIYGGAFFLLVTAAMLVLSSDLVDAMLPALFLAVSVTKLYNILANEVWKQQLYDIGWVLIPLLAAVIFHFAYYRKPIRIGPSFWGLCAISVALLLGGVGTISSAEYFAPAALFYTLGLGVGMVAFYLLVKSHLSDTAGKTVAISLYLIGLYAGFCVIMFYVRDMAGHSRFLESGNETVRSLAAYLYSGSASNNLFLTRHQFLNFQSSNNLSTFLLLTMPFPLYWAAKNPAHILSVVFMYICLVFSGSRGGLVMGTIELLLLMIAYIVIFPRNRRQRIVASCATAVLCISFIACIPIVISLFQMPVSSDEAAVGISGLWEKLRTYMLNSDEPRLKLMKQMVYDFIKNPAFGVGIGYTGNENLYNPVTGAMNWYHMWFAQIIGGLGALGIAAYGFQLVDRVRIFLRNRSRLTWAMFLSYIGLFLMSQVNPGEFCPVPYAMLAVTFFAIMEQKMPVPSHATQANATTLSPQ